MKLVSGIVDSGFFAQSALSAEVATKDSLGRNISETYLTGVDLTPYQTTAGMTAYQSAGEYYSASNPSGFLVADDITGKLDASVYAADSGSFLTAVPDTYLQNTDLEISDNKITGISGVPLAAGGDVPEGVMVESGLEYNAVQEISGYNGSAIAQYGAEKQFIVHDDTLVHLSNSAQYALGVNLSAVAQLLGVDETVILDRGTDDLTAPNTAQLSEPFSAFEKIEMWCVWNPWPTNVPQATYYPGDATAGSYMVFDNSQFMRAGYGLWRTTGTTIQLISASQTTNWPTFQNASTGLGGIRKIVGIGRRQ